MSAQHQELVFPLLDLVLTVLTITMCVEEQSGMPNICLMPSTTVLGPTNPLNNTTCVEYLSLAKSKVNAITYGPLLPAMERVA